MNIKRTFTLALNDFKMGPRSPVVIWMLLMPVLITFLLQIVFMTLFDPAPRLGIVDYGHSEITTSVQEMEGIELQILDNETELLRLVKGNNLDAGLILNKDFDSEVRTGKKPLLNMYISGESLLVNRVVIAVTAIDLVRKVENKEAPVTVVLNSLAKNEVLPISKRLVPAIVLFVLIVAGIFIPAFNLVEEREHHTLDAILVTPVTITDILLSKAVFGFVMSLVMSILTLALNGALSAEPAGLILSLSIGAVICIEIGLIYGTVAKDAKSLYTLVKTLNILFIGPVIFYIFPNWPQWIAKLFPTYWFIDPIYQVALKGASLSDVWTDLAIACGVAVLLIVPIIFFGRRMRSKLAAS